ncbi:MAG: thioredoxin domain-containing protein [bacterium]|nr:thioredoxin domain-containing protein [bacterium]
MSDLIEVTDANFEELMLRADKLAVLDFGAEWCAPCKKVHALLKELAPSWSGRVVMGEIDIAANPDVPRRYRVINIPQVLFFKNGQHVDTIAGVLPKAKFEEKLKSHLG